jgi:hypothetical protein
MNKTTYNLLLGYFVVSALLILIGTGIFTVIKYQESQKEIERLVDISTNVSEKEFESILETVGKHIVLPEGESPTIATVSDVEILKESQPFFKNAKNGDRVLVYQEAKKAYLYDPKADKIVDVGTVNLEDKK